MDYENRIVFPYIEELLGGKPSGGFRISDFASKHESVVSKLNELKDIFLQHYVMPNTRMLNRALLIYRPAVKILSLIVKSRI